MPTPCVYTMSLAGQEMQTTVDVDFVAPITPFAIKEILEDFWVNGLAQSMSNALALTSIKVGPDPFSATGVGGIVQPSANSSAAAIVNKVNDGPRGRFFMSGLPRDAVIPDGSLLAAWIATYENQLQTAFAAVNATDVILVVTNPSGATRPISGFTISPVIGLQGRRRLGR